MKANSQVRNIKKTLSVQVQPIKYEPSKEMILEKWKGCLALIDDILDRGSVDFCFQELYQNINDLIMFDIPANVVKAIDDLFMKHAKKVSSLLTDLVNISNIDDFFQNFNLIWKKTKANFNLLRKILVKFEKKYFSINGQGSTVGTNLPVGSIHHSSVWTLFLDYLKLNFSRDNSFVQALIERVLYKIALFREAVYISQNLNINLDEINEGINLLWETGLYREIFHENFINSSLEFYNQLGEKIISLESIETYTSFVEKSFDVETKLISTNLNEFSLRKMISNLETKFITDKKLEILKKVFDSEKCSLFFDESRIQFLKRIYFLYKRVKIEDELRKSWFSFICSSAEKIYQEFGKNAKIVKFFESIILLKKNIDNTLKEAFLNDDKFKSTAKEGFVKTLNLKPNAVADYLSRYIDHVLTDSDTDDKFISSKVDEFMTVFKFLDAKDMFEQFFIKKLANRLLYSLTSSTKGEKYLIEKLRSECGSVFVTKSEEMLMDIENSHDLTLNFKNEINKIETNFYVLSTYSWPVTKVITGVITPEVTQMEKNFTLYYKNKNAGKALNWHLPYCSGELSYNIGGNKNVTLQVNGIQAAILTKFTKNKLSLSLSDFLRLTEIEKDELVSNLDFMTNNIRILNKEGEKYLLNSGFTPSKTHLIINNFANKEETSVEEIREVEERNWEDRKHVLDALIMKVLKAKKQLKQTEIISSVLGAVKFPCEISSVSTRVQFLISGGYLSKDDKDEELIKYN